MADWQAKRSVFRLAVREKFAHKWGMKNSMAPQTPFRPLYASMIVVAALLLWVLARPRPGVRTVDLQPVLAPENGGNRSTPPINRVRVATYNLEHFTDARGDGPERTPDLFNAHARGAAEIIAEANPDVLLLQEVENARALEYLNSQLEHPYDYAYLTDLRNSSGVREKLNLGLLSRLRPARARQLGFHALDGAGRPTRGTLSAAFDLGDGTSLLTYNLHLKSNFGEAPRNQAQRAIALHLIAADVVSESFRNLPSPTASLVLGDTNVDPDTEQFATDPSLEPLAGSFVDLWLGRSLEERTTIPTRHAGDTNLVFPPSAFDRVFASKNLAANGPWKVSAPRSIQKGTATHDNTLLPGVDGHVTDHYLVYVDLIRTPSP